ncbi:hypothetical protein CTI12_AA007590 [Artemisia annua]|uniref:Uncharacterized protein n=1 Tax=Artemisia annua TaxID=35608 RepID=A0A2U1QN64_ARTAN|nr:hypothetical protein CTI12_AA007590 [Artemisia annua]
MPQQKVFDELSEEKVEGIGMKSKKLVELDAKNMGMVSLDSPKDGDTGEQISKDIEINSKCWVAFDSRCNGSEIEKTKACVQVIQEDKEDDLVKEDYEIICLDNLGYGVDGMRTNASTNGVSKTDVFVASDDGWRHLEDQKADFKKSVDVVQMHSSKHNTVKMGKSFEILSILQDSFRKCYKTQLFKLEFTCGLLRSFEFGDDKLHHQRRWIKDLEKETRGFIYVVVSQVKIGTTASKRNEVTCDLEFDKQWGGLKRKWTHLDVESLFGHFRVLKYGASFGYLKFDIWKWHTRKKIRGTQCKVKLRKWKWPKRKKDIEGKSYV